MDVYMKKKHRRGGEKWPGDRKGEAKAGGRERERESKEESLRAAIANLWSLPQK